MPSDHDSIPVEARPVETTSKQRSLPPIVAKTVNLCVNCVTGAGRLVGEPLRRRHERHYHARFRFGRTHLAVDLVFVAAILALIGTNAYLLFGRPRLPQSAMTLEWNAAPAIARSGDTVTFTLILTHDGDEPFENATVALRLPERFVVTSVTPTTYDAVTHTVRIGTLAPGASSRVDVRGITDAPDGATLRMEATFHGTGATRSERVVASGAVDIHGVAVNFAIGPQGDGPAIIRLGQSVEISASYYAAENEPTPLDARAFRVTVSGSLPSNITAITPHATARRGEIRWPFRDVRPVGETVGEAFMLTPPTGAESITVPAGALASYTITPELILAEDAAGTPLARLIGSPFILPVAGELRLAASARYFTPEGDQIGRGPLPPRVGATTKYWVTWDARSILRDANRVVVRAPLPPGVEWTGRVMSTAGVEPTFDASSRTVTWAIGNIERLLSTSFELAVTPTAGQTGSFAALLGETKTQGVDNLGTEIVASASAVTTELRNDDRVSGKGRVIEK